MTDIHFLPPTQRVWQVGALCRAIADALGARFNPIVVAGEVTGFSRASSGHCYFSLKDETGQIRCAMFRRAAGLLDFPVRDGDRVEVRGKVGIYEQRGELQLVVDSMRAAGQGTLFEQFFKLKAKLEQEGLFDVTRKRILPTMPRGIGIVTSLGAAALHDVVATLQRRVPHIPVVLAPASVQGEAAPRELMQALQGLYRLNDEENVDRVHIDVILLVRGGGAMEDLWAFNDEFLARALAESPVPIICGVGHETDFTIADFVVDLRAPTPTAAAEMVCESTQNWLSSNALLTQRMWDAMTHYVDRQAQRLDLVSSRLGRPSILAGRQRLKLESTEQRMRHALRAALQDLQNKISQRQQTLSSALRQTEQRRRERLQRAELRLGLLDPSLVLKRGYSWLTMGDGQPLSSVTQAHAGDAVRATLVDGVVDLRIISTASI